MFTEFIKALGLIFIAEMGDKTQILAMAFATRFKVKVVLLGIFLGSLFNHGLAVILGSYLSRFIPINTIQIMAGFAFVGFSLWTLKVEEDTEEEEKNTKSFGPVFTVAIAFFIGELGDKTQLTAITLSADALYPPVVLMGTVSGMIVTGGLGIFVGKKLGNKIPEFTIKIIAASIFMFFGLAKLYTTVPGQYLKIQYIILFLVVVAVVAFLRVKLLLKIRAKDETSKYVRVSEALYGYYSQMDNRIEEICLGENYCGNCKRNKCVIGYTKSLIKQVEENDNDDIILEYNSDKISIISDSKKDRVIEALITTIKILSNNSIEEKDTHNIHKIRQNFEKVLFEKSINDFDNWEDYITIIKKIDEDIANKIADELAICIK